jgi:hypothetical protein
MLDTTHNKSPAPIRGNTLNACSASTRIRAGCFWSATDGR